MKLAHSDNISLHPDRFFIGGVKINAVSLTQTIEIMDYWIGSRRKNYIVLTGAHGVVEMQNDHTLKAINNNAGLTTPDGMPEVWIGKFKGFSNIEKVYAPEIMEAAFEKGIKQNYRHFFYGGKDGVAEKLKQKLEVKYPGIQIVGTYCPPFRELTDVEVEEVSSKINESKADIVWCGLGCPKQEKWMAKFRPLVNASVLIGVGAGFDFLSGEKPLAPYWITRSGFEWLYRSFTEPKRMVKRYGVIVPKFLLLIFYELITGQLFTNKFGEN